jgi:hypothetical protein
MKPPPILRATIAHPVIIYYCKAGIQTGTTIRVQHHGQVHACRGVFLHGCNAGMFHDNSTGKPKASGARCVLTVTTGIVGLETHPRSTRELEIADMHALERDCLIFFDEAGEENLYYRDVFQRRYVCKPGGQSLNGHKLLGCP